MAAAVCDRLGDSNMTEGDIQNQIRIALSAHGVFFRANVGTAWTGDSVKRIGRNVLITNARQFSTGLPVGFSDLFGITDKGRFVAVEVKTPTGKVRPEQLNFIDVIRKRGGLAGVARSVDDALQILKEGGE